LVAVGAVALSGCGGSSGTAQQHPANKRADVALAKAAVLHQADLAGYSAKPNSKSPPDATLNGKLAKCVGPEVAPMLTQSAPDEASAVSPKFERGNTAISAEVDIDERVAAVASEMKLVRAAMQRPCVVKLLREALGQPPAGKVLPPGVRLDPSLSTYPIDDIGEGGFGISGSLTFVGPTKQATFSLDILVVRKGRAVVELSFDTPGATNVGLENKLVKKMIARLGDQVT
jgi:hypothetical protein